MKRCAIGLSLILLMGITGCEVSTGEDGNVRAESSAGTAGDLSVHDSPDVVIPDCPLGQSTAVVVSVSLVEEAADQYCREKGNQATAGEFFMGYLPLWSADRLCGAGEKEVAALLGNLHVSGYFGGLWLRDVLDSGSEDTEAVSSPVKSAMVEYASRSGQTWADGAVARFLESVVKSNMETVTTGSTGKVLAWDRLSIEPFLMLYGYNWGYFMYILENPPEGIPEPPGYDEVCSRFMDCEVPGATLEMLDRYKPALEFLYEPETLRWKEMNMAMNVWGKGAVAMGENVWEIIMANSRMSSPETYDLLLNLSGRFMMMAELSLLASMDGYAEQDEDTARCGILQETAMITWAASYFMGLGSDDPEGTFPSLIP